jgi:hypothetical protein
MMTRLFPRRNKPARTSAISHQFLVVPLLAREPVPSQPADSAVYTAVFSVPSPASINFTPTARTKTLPLVTMPTPSRTLQALTPTPPVALPNPLGDGELAEKYGSLQKPTSGIFISADALKALLTGQAEAQMALADMKKKLESHSRMLQELLCQKESSYDCILDSLNLPINSREDLKTFERLLRFDNTIFGKVVSIY